MIMRRKTFLISFILTTMIGVIAGKELFDNSGSLRVEGMSNHFNFFLIWVIEVGLSMGFLQWLFIQQELKERWWLVVTFFGLSVGGILGGGIQGIVESFMYSNMLYTALCNFLIGGSVGFCIGISQWLFLRRLLPQSSSWIIACTIGWAMGLTFYRTLDLPDLLMSVPLLSLIFRALTLSIPVAGVTGYAIHLMITQKQSV